MKLFRLESKYDDGMTMGTIIKIALAYTSESAEAMLKDYYGSDIYGKITTTELPMTERLFDIPRCTDFNN